MKNILFLSFSVLLFSCGGENKNETKQNETKTSQSENQTDSKLSVETPLNGEIKEIKKIDHGVEFLVKVECLVDEKTTPNYLYTKLVDEDGLECGVELSMDSKQPLFNFKDMYKGDKSTGWLTFKFPNSNYKPKKIVFNAIMGGKLCEIMVNMK